MEKRRHQRMTVDSLWADVSDGRGFFSGMVTDLSRFGLGVTDLPVKLDHTSQRFSIVISGHGRNFKMLVKPRWVKTATGRKWVGVEILNAPWAWTEFVMAFKPQPVDVWGDTAI
jgi:hypothetical protein